MKLSGKLLVVFFVLLVCSCTKEDRENTMARQEEAIDSYISSLQNMEVVRNGGSNRIIVEGGSGTEGASKGDSLYIRYAGYIFTRGKGALLSTNDAIIATENGFPCMEAPLKMRLGSGGIIKGLELGLEGVKEGEHCYVIFSAKYGYGNTQVYNIPKLTPLFYEVWIDKVIKK